MSRRTQRSADRSLIPASATSRPTSAWPARPSGELTPLAGRRPSGAWEGVLVCSAGPPRDPRKAPCRKRRKPCPVKPLGAPPRSRSTPARSAETAKRKDGAPSVRRSAHAQVTQGYSSGAGWDLEWRCGGPAPRPQPPLVVPMPPRQEPRREVTQRDTAPSNATIYNRALSSCSVIWYDRCVEPSDSR